MAASSKITNDLFVWGNVVSGQSSDLSEFTPDPITKTVPGEKAGDLLYAAKYNTILRESTLIPYSLIEALRYGPYGQQSGEILDGSSTSYNNTWDADLSSMTIDYGINSTDINTDLVPQLRTIFNQYLKYAQTYRSIQANCWTNPRTFEIVDASDTNTGVASTVDGSSNVLLYLPSTIVANINGTSSNITTTTDNTHDLYLTGVTSGATTTLKRNTHMSINGSTLTIGTFTNPGEILLPDGNLHYGGIKILDGVHYSGITLSYDNSDYSIQIGTGGFTLDLQTPTGYDNLLRISDEGNSIGDYQILQFDQETFVGEETHPDYCFEFKRPIRMSNKIAIANDLLFTGNSVESSTYHINSSGTGKLNTVDFVSIGTNNTFVPNAYITTIVAQTVTATSDARLKENIKTFEPHESILDLDVVEFDYKETGKHAIGCIAQELQEICPEIVHEDKNGYLSIEENKIVYLLLDEVKKLRKELDELKGK